MRALPEIPWTAVKITAHSHGFAEPVYEENAAGEGSDTARYLAAGARRALLVTAENATLGAIVKRILLESAPDSGVIFESNSVLVHVKPDLCLGVVARPTAGSKPSFEMVERCMDAMVELAGHDHVIPGERLGFHLVSLEKPSAPMIAWLGEHLRNR